MPTRYTSLSMPNVHGKLLDTTSRGDIVIEDDEGRVHVLSPSDAIPSDAISDTSFTFEVESLNLSYRRNYILPEGVSINVGDILLPSDNSNLYVVTKLNTQQAINKGEFKGHRILKESL